MIWSFSYISQCYTYPLGMHSVHCKTIYRILYIKIHLQQIIHLRLALCSIVLNFMTEGLTVWALLLIKKKKKNILSKEVHQVRCSTCSSELFKISKGHKSSLPSATICIHFGNAKIQRPEHTGRHLPWTDCFHRNIVVQKFDQHIIIMSQSR